MAPPKRPSSAARDSANDSQPPTEYAQVPPREIYPASDVRTLLIEMGKVSTKVDRLVDDVKDQDKKVDELRQKAAFIQGAIYVSTAFLTFIIAAATFILNGKWSAAIAALSAYSHAAGKH